MTDLQKSGGWSALFIAASYVFGFGLFLGVLDRTGYEGTAGDLAFVLDHQLWLSAAMIALYVVAGCALVVLVLAVHQRLAPSESGWVPVATGFGLIWAGLVLASGFVGLTGIRAVAELAASDPETAGSAWVAIAVVQDALGGGIELVGGVWLIFISAIAIASQAFSKPLNFLGIAIGIVGIATVFPGLGDLAAVFGLTQIVWFGWIAFLMIAEPHRQ